jgi:hypothetical protein
MLQLLSHRPTQPHRNVRGLRIAIGHQSGTADASELRYECGGEFSLHDCYGYEVKSVHA